ncbi:unnamed protein product [Choristocarpus tenellus]
MHAMAASDRAADHGCGYGQLGLLEGLGRAGTGSKTVTHLTSPGEWDTRTDSSAEKLSGPSRGRQGAERGKKKGSLDYRDSQRLFGEALVLYLKSLSMAKEAIVWGRQALESLAESSLVRTPPTASPNRNVRPGVVPATTPPPLHRGRRAAEAVTGGDGIGGGAQGAGGGWGGSRASPSPRGGQVHPSALGVEGTGALYIGVALRGGVGGGREGGGSMSMDSLESQVYVWGESLVKWLTDQFSAILGRAERCKAELLEGEDGASGRGGVGGTDSSRVWMSNVVDKRVSMTGRGDQNTDSVSQPPFAVAASLSMSSPLSLSPEGYDGVLPISESIRAGQRNEGGESMPGGVTGEGVGGGNDVVHAADMSLVDGGGESLAVSARGIVVRSALTLARESAASEMLGMWDLAREGYEKVQVI